MENKSKNLKTTFYSLKKTQMIQERVRSKVLDNIFISLIESKLHLHLTESAMYNPHPVSIFPTAVILYDHGIFVTTKKPI